MLGDLLCEAKGRITGKRVLSITHGSKVETSRSREGEWTRVY